MQLVQCDFTAKNGAKTVLTGHCKEDEVLALLQSNLKKPIVNCVLNSKAQDS